MEKKTKTKKSTLVAPILAKKPSLWLYPMFDDLMIFYPDNHNKIDVLNYFSCNYYHMNMGCRFRSYKSNIISYRVFLERNLKRDPMSDDLLFVSYL